MTTRTGRSEHKVTDYLHAVYRWITPFVDLKEMMRAIPAYGRYIKDWMAYSRRDGAEPMAFVDSMPQLHDRTKTTAFDSHYFYQDIWAFKKIHASAVSHHVDVGSRADFIGFVTGVTRVSFIDIRPLVTDLDNYESIEGSILAMPFGDNSVSSISCLHVAEHIGLGRYGDPLNPRGTQEAAGELKRVLAHGGSLFFSLPVGRPRVCFNAHRIHSPVQIRDLFADLELVEFSGIDDRGAFMRNADLEEFANQVYACGLFWFRKPGPGGSSEKVFDV